jgi:methionyl aminopeptidase
MAPLIKSKEEVAKIRETGHIVAAILADLRAAVEPGITTADLDALAVERLKRYGAKSSSLGYHGYPASICASVNEEIVHGIPGPRVLREGDIVAIDFAANYNGWHADAAITVPVGKVASEVQRLLKVTEEALYLGIANARAGKRLHDVSRAIQRYVESAGFSLVRQYGGHGVGRDMHEDPQILNYIERDQPNLLLRPGWVVAIEPMVNMGQKEFEVLDDQWTVVTADRSYSAHFEHTVAIGTGEPEILTRV